MICSTHKIIFITTSYDIKKMFTLCGLYKLFQNAKSTKKIKKMHKYNAGPYTDYYVEYKIKCDFKDKFIQIDHRTDIILSGLLCHGQIVSGYRLNRIIFYLDNNLDISSCDIILKQKGSDKDTHFDSSLDEYCQEYYIEKMYDITNDSISRITNSDAFTNVMGTIPYELNNLLDDHEYGYSYDEEYNSDDHGYDN